MSIEQLGEPVEVAETRTRGQLPRLLFSLLGIGVVIGLILGVGGLFFGNLSQTEAGLCRLTWAACTELSAGSVENLSGVDLPEGTVVVSGYAQELASLREFRAEVILPKGGQVTMSNAYSPGDPPADVPAAARGLEFVTFWSRPVHDPDGRSIAVVGVGADGRTVIVFDERQVPSGS